MAKPDFKFDKLHEVVGYGRVQHEGRRILVEILFRPAREGKPAFLSTSDVPLTKWISCGQLPLVPIGSQWLGDEWQANRI
jgi:hypothetical protein